MRSPKENTAVIIKSYKHNGRLHREWETNFLLKATNTYVIGANDKVKVTEDDGRFWITREPAILYFHAEYWFNVIGMIREDGVHYYCNISSPFLYDGEAIKYIDYDLDVRVFPNMTYILLDEDEYEQHKSEMNYSSRLDRILHTQLDYLLRWIHERKGPFSPEFIDRWYEQYLLYH